LVCYYAERKAEPEQPSGLRSALATLSINLLVHQATEHHAILQGPIHRYP
jgi:hypothetical protein